LSIRLKNGPVLASGIVSLAGALLLPTIHGENATTLSAVVMAASFVGMSSKKRLKNELEVLLSGAIMGILFVYSVNHFRGAGGKLGILAFASVVSANGIFFLIKQIAHRRTH
jgi:lipopolysaccharide export LptBFGC system permease protein LptF